MGRSQTHRPQVQHGLAGGLDPTELVEAQPDCPGQILQLPGHRLVARPARRLLTQGFVEERLQVELSQLGDRAADIARVQTAPRHIAVLQREQHLPAQQSR
jgi:hypothetical protein